MSLIKLLKDSHLCFDTSPTSLNSFSIYGDEDFKKYNKTLQFLQVLLLCQNSKTHEHLKIYYQVHILEILKAEKSYSIL